MSPDSHSHPDWTGIDTVLLDLDGTLLDQAYDNHIWRDLVPQRFAVANSLEMHAAYAEIKRRFAERSGTLDWYRPRLPFGARSDTIKILFLLYLPLGVPR